jgi:hypothetical protein
VIGPLALTNCTVSGNTATGGIGGGLYNNSGTPSLTNTIVAGNSGGDIAGSYTSSHSLVGGDPLLAALGDYGGPTSTMALLPGSPAIGVGTSAGAPATDQRGEPRSGHVDIGAFQSQGFTLTPVTGGTPQSAVVETAFGHPLAVTVAPANPVEPVDGGVVNFAAPTTGASATLSAATVTIANGQAAVTATADTTSGAYTVTALTAGATTAAGFALTNAPGSAATVAVVSGSGQTAAVATAFADPMVVVVEDAHGNPVPGVSVSFAAPASGASATLSGSPAVTGADGQAGVTATAGTIVGSYTLTASVAGVTTPASFALTNTAATLKLMAQPVAAVAGRAFINVVVAAFTDSDSDPNASPSDFVAAIAWGDGITTSSTTVIADGQGRFHVLGTHTYVDAGTYTFRVQVTDNGGASATATSTATVTAHANIEAPSPVPATPRDPVEQFDDLTSLRAAIAYANSHSGPDTITFDPAGSRTRPKTIRLIGGPLVLTNPAGTSIVGPGDKLLTFRGNGKSSVFEVQSGGSLALSGLTIAGGRAENGGGIRNDGGKLSLTNVILRNNSARVLGGGLFNNGDATLTNVTVSGDSAKVGGGIANQGTLVLTHVAIRRDFAQFASGLFDNSTVRLLSRRLPGRSAGGDARG